MGYSAETMTFGIEIECLVNKYATLRDGSQVTWLPEGWKSVRDGSLRDTPTKHATEFVSPVLQGEAGLRQVCEVLTAIKAHGGRVTTRGGIHVHVGFPKNTKKIQKLINITANYEQAIYASTGTVKRQQSGWCASARTAYRDLNVESDIQANGGSTRGDNADMERVAHNGARAKFMLLNLSKLTRGTGPTIEFRAFAGTLNATKLTAHITTCLGIAERALSGAAVRFEGHQPMSKKKYRVEDGGEGCYEVERMMANLGWTTAKRAYGIIEGDGIPSMQARITELRRLAKKYDADPRFNGYAPRRYASHY